MPYLRKQNINIAVKGEATKELGLKLGEIGTDGQNLFIGKSNGNVSLTIPIGSIMAWHPGSFSSAGNNGYVNLESLISLPNGFVETNGKLIKDSESPFDGYYLPDLTNNIFLMGTNTIVTTVLGQDYSFGGVNHLGPQPHSANNADNTITLTTNFIPPHYHSGGTLNLPTKNLGPAGYHAHGTVYPRFNVHRNHGNGPWPSQHLGATTKTTSDAGAHSHTVSISSGEFGGILSDGSFANDIISIIPKYLSVKFIIRVK